MANSERQATITWVFLYDGPQQAAAPILKPFDQLHPLSVVDLTIPYKDLNTQIGGAINGSLCEPNKSHVVGTANLQTYNVTSMRAIYDLYNQKINQYPRLGGTRVLVEGYAVQGVRSFKAEDSAFPLRNDFILTLVSFPSLPLPSHRIPSLPFPSSLDFIVFA